MILQVSEQLAKLSFASNPGAGVLYLGEIITKTITFSVKKDLYIDPVKVFFYQMR